MRQTFTYFSDPLPPDEPHVRFIETEWLKFAPAGLLATVKAITNGEEPTFFYEVDGRLFVALTSGTVLMRTENGAWHCVSRGRPLLATAPTAGFGVALG